MLLRRDQALAGIMGILAVQPHDTAVVLALTNVLGLPAPADSDEDPHQLASSALLALATFGPRTAPALPVLRDVLTSTNSRLQACAAIAAAEAGMPPDELRARLPQSRPTVAAAHSRFSMTADFEAERIDRMLRYALQRTVARSSPTGAPGSHRGSENSSSGNLHHPAAAQSQQSELGISPLH